MRISYALEPKVVLTLSPSKGEGGSHDLTNTQREYSLFFWAKSLMP